MAKPLKQRQGFVRTSTCSLVVRMASGMSKLLRELREFTQGDSAQKRMPQVLWRWRKHSFVKIRFALCMKQCHSAASDRASTGDKDRCY